MTTNEQIGYNIKKWRELKDIKQELLAKKLKITSAALSNVENGKTDITVKRIEQIVEILQIDFSLLLSGPQGINTNKPNNSNEINKDHSQHNGIHNELLHALKIELKIKNEQIAFLQNLLQLK